MSRVVSPTSEELIERRRLLLERAGAEYAELERRAKRHDLSGDEWFLWEQIRSIDFLLGEPPSHGEHD